MAREERGRFDARDEEFMRQAIRLSALAVEHGNEPYGSVLVKDGEIVCGNENQVLTTQDPTFHSETGLIRRFCRENGIRDLSDYTMYSSCEPCFMCSGAIVKARLGRLVYAVSDLELGEKLGRPGAACSRIVFEHSANRPQVDTGLLREESLEILLDYYRKH